MTRNRVPALPPSLETRRRRSVCSVLPLATSYSVRELHLSLAMCAVPSASRPVRDGGREEHTSELATAQPCVGTPVAQLRRAITSGCHDTLGTAAST